MSAQDSLVADRERGTTQAWMRAKDGTPTVVLSFLDLVREGEIVHVFPTLEDAENETGFGEPMVVRYDSGEWFVEAVDA